MKKSELKQLIKEIISEYQGQDQISPQEKAIMLQRLQTAQKHVQKVKTFEELHSMSGSEYDQNTGTFSVDIQYSRTDKYLPDK